MQRFRTASKKPKHLWLKFKPERRTRRILPGSSPAWTINWPLVQKDLKTGLEKLQADIKSIEKKMSDEFAKSFETVNNVTTRIAECQADIGLLSAEKADKKLTEIALKNQEKHFQDQTSQLLRNLESKMEVLNAGIKELEKIKSAMEKSPRRRL